MSARHSKMLLALVLVAFARTGSAADNVLSPRPSRVDQIARVHDMLADPDSTVRLINMETIVNSGDAILINVAMRTAFSSDDQQLRGLALRAYVARYKELTLDVELPADARARVEEAQADGEMTHKLQREFPYVLGVQRMGGKIRLVVDSYSFPDDRGKLEGRPPVPFAIVGDRFSAAIPLRSAGMGGCAVEFRPTDKSTLDGTLACPRGWPKLRVSAAIQ